MDGNGTMGRRIWLGAVLAVVLVAAVALGAFWPLSESPQPPWARVFLYAPLGILAALFLVVGLIHIRKLRFSLALMLLMTVLLSELLAVWALSPTSQVRRRGNWWQVEVGMTEGEVESIMGSRGAPKPAGGGEVNWLYDYGVTISFRNGRVTDAFRLQ